MNHSIAPSAPLLSTSQNYAYAVVVPSEEINIDMGACGSHAQVALPISTEGEKVRDNYNVVGGSYGDKRQTSTAEAMPVIHEGVSVGLDPNTRGSIISDVITAKLSVAHDVDGRYLVARDHIAVASSMPNAVNKSENLANRIVQASNPHVLSEPTRDMSVRLPEDTIPSSSPYQPPKLGGSEYVIPEYKSVYEAPSAEGGYKIPEYKSIYES